MPCTGSASEGGHRYAEALRLGGVAGAAADPLAQADKFCRQAGELHSELFVFLAQQWILLLWMQDQKADTGRPCQPIR